MKHSCSFLMCIFSSDEEVCLSHSGLLGEHADEV